MSFEGIEGVGRYNPDRVKVKQTGSAIEYIEVNHPDELMGHQEYVEGPTSVNYTAEGFDRIAGKTSVWAILGAAAITAGSNFGIEKQSGSTNEKTTNAVSVQEGLAAQNIEVFARNVQSEVCRYIDSDFMHRFTTKDSSGNETFNPGAFIIPLAVSLTESCNARVDVEIHIPYHFARTFREVVAKSPQSRDQMIANLADFIKKEAENQVVIRGVAGLTDTALVWNKSKNALLVGDVPKIDFGKFDVSNLSLEGVASGEASASSQNKAEKSLGGFNPENINLAERRLNEFSPLLKEAFMKLGIKLDVIANAKTFNYEHNLISDEIKELADISRQVFGETIQGDEAALAYTLVSEYNVNNPKAIAALNDIPGARERLKQLLDNERGVNVSFTAETEYQKENVYNLGLPLPIFLLLLSSLRLGLRREEGYVIESIVEVPVPASILEMHIHTFEPTARRIFSESTPSRLDQPRDFNEVYDNLDTTSRPEDSQNLLIHMLIEEVMPSLTSETKEPMIDYEEIVNKHRDRLFSSTVKGGVEKGRYETTEEAQRLITSELIDMWERHDAATYPMDQIDIKEVINYRHSEHVVYWAKVLAECLVKSMSGTVTSEEFRMKLEDQIIKAINVRTESKATHNNEFVVSKLPLSN